MCAGDVGVAGDGFVFFVVHGVAFRRLMFNDGLTVGAAECSAAMGLNLRRRCFRLLGDDDGCGFFCGDLDRQIERALAWVGLRDCAVFQRENISDFALRLRHFAGHGIGDLDLIGFGFFDLDFEGQLARLAGGLDGLNHLGQLRIQLCAELSCADDVDGIVKRWVG